MCLTATHPQQRGSAVTLQPCSSGGDAAGQQWDVQDSGVSLAAGGQPLGIQNGGRTNAVVWLGTKTPMQYNSSTNTFELQLRGGFNNLVQNNLCLGFSRPVRPCDAPSPAATFPM